MKNRIKELGFTQQEFADSCKIGLSSLKKYLSGTNAYDYEVLEIFANKLECTYDYLLGKSKVPEREYQDIRNQLPLSIRAIENLYEYEKIEKRMDAVNYILESKSLMGYMDSFLNMNEEGNNVLMNTVMLPLFNILNSDVGGILSESDIPNGYVISELSLQLELRNVRDRYRNRT